MSSSTCQVIAAVGVDDAPAAPGLRERLVRTCERVPARYVTGSFGIGLIACLVGARVHVAVVYLLGWTLLLAGSLLRPRWGLMALLVVALFFSEERWQPFLFAGSTGSVPDTVYTIHVVGLKVQWALAGGVVLWGLIEARALMGLQRRAAFVSLCLFLVADVWAEILGRATTGYAEHLFGQWALIAAPVLVSLAALALLSRDDVVVGFRALVALGTVRLVFGLLRYGAGGGDWSYELGRRVVFWDSADGFVAVLVAVTGLAMLLGFSGQRVHDRIVGGAMLLASVAVVVLSLRRQALLMLAVSVVVLLALTWRPKRGVLIASVAVVAMAAAIISLAVMSSDSVIAARVRSMNPFDRGSASATNAFHIEDIREGVLSAAERPWTGWGFHTNVERESDYFLLLGSAPLPVTVKHNMYLDVWVRMGVLGVVALLALLVSGWRAGWATLRGGRDVTTSVLMALLAGCVVSSLFMPVLNSNRWPYFLLMPVVGLVVLSASRRRRTALVANGS